LRLLGVLAARTEFLSTWIKNIGAFVETCRRVELPVAVERSRFGDGAHVWFFFSSSVPVTAAIGFPPFI